MDELKGELLKLARNYLDITWPDAEGDQKLLGIIGRGVAYIDAIAGKEQDYTIENAAQALLLNYCRYDRDRALDEFQGDFLHELLALQLAEGVTNDETTEPDI